MTPECGSTKCKLQAKNHRNDKNPLFGTTITISFTIVIKSLPSTLPAIIDKIREINEGLDGLVQDGLTFEKGTTTSTIDGKYLL